MNETKGLVTVIIPVYNGEKYLLETLLSVAASVYEYFEIVIVDDGSTDGTLEISTRFAQESAVRVKVVSQENRGESAAINKGLEHAHGEFVLVLSSDDLIHPNLFTRGVGLLEENQTASLAYPDWQMIDATGNHLRTVINLDWNLEMLFFANKPGISCLPGPGTLIRRSAIKDNFLRDPRFRLLSDVESYRRLAVAGPFVRVPFVLASWRNHSEGASASTAVEVRAQESLLVTLSLFKEPSRLPQEILIFENLAKADAYWFSALQSLHLKLPSKNKLLRFAWYATVLCVGQPRLATKFFRGFDWPALMLVLANPFGRMWINRRRAS